ncbi:hypothetical protein T492DRAFT_902108 [Pavlovales sp. CCMP2436]|nr:hypothetical protein T492DRAFT_902108 [Pavlovales sp. CCMP2436]
MALALLWPAVLCWRGALLPTRPPATEAGRALPRSAFFAAGSTGAGGRARDHTRLCALGADAAELVAADVLARHTAQHQALGFHFQRADGVVELSELEAAVLARELGLATSYVISEASSARGAPADRDDAGARFENGGLFEKGPAAGGAVSAGGGGRRAGRTTGEAFFREPVEDLAELLDLFPALEELSMLPRLCRAADAAAEWEQGVFLAQVELDWASGGAQTPEGDGGAGSWELGLGSSWPGARGAGAVKGGVGLGGSPGGVRQDAHWLDDIVSEPELLSAPDTPPALILAVQLAAFLSALTAPSTATGAGGQGGGGAQGGHGAISAQGGQGAGGEGEGGDGGGEEALTTRAAGNLLAAVNPARLLATVHDVGLAVVAEKVRFVWGSLCARARIGAPSALTRREAIADTDGGDEEEDSKSEGGAGGLPAGRPQGTATGRLEALALADAEDALAIACAWEWSAISTPGPAPAWLSRGEGADGPDAGSPDAAAASSSLGGSGDSPNSTVSVPAGLDAAVAHVLLSSTAAQIGLAAARAGLSGPPSPADSSPVHSSLEPPSPELPSSRLPSPSAAGTDALPTRVPKPWGREPRGKGGGRDGAGAGFKGEGVREAAAARAEAEAQAARERVDAVIAGAPALLCGVPPAEAQAGASPEQLAAGDPGPWHLPSPGPQPSAAAAARGSTAPAPPATPRSPGGPEAADPGVDARALELAAELAAEPREPHARAQMLFGALGALRAGLEAQLPGAAARGVLARAPRLALALLPGAAAVRLPAAVRELRASLPEASANRLVAFVAAVPWALERPSLLRARLQAMQAALPPGVRADRLALGSPRLLNLRSLKGRLRALCALLPEASPAVLAAQLPSLLGSDEAFVKRRIELTRGLMSPDEWAHVVGTLRLGRVLLSSVSAIERLRVVRAALPMRTTGARPAAVHIVTMSEASFADFVRGLDADARARARAAGATGARPPRVRGAESKTGAAARRVPPRSAAGASVGDGEPPPSVASPRRR